MADRALAPVAQKQVVFYDDELTAVCMADGHIYIPVWPICDILGVALAGQRERIIRYQRKC